MTMQEAIVRPSPARVMIPRLTFDGVNRRLARIFDEVGERVDANETVLATRQLTQIMARPFMARYPEIKWRQILPINTEFSNGARAHTYMLFDEQAQAHIISDMGGEFPNAEVNATETVGKFFSIGSSYGYSVQDLRSAQYAGVALDIRKGVVARRLSERKVDALACVGQTSLGLTGLANDANIPATTKGTQASGTTWATATPDEIVTDFNLQYSTVFTGSKGAHEPNTALVGTAGWAKITTTRMDSFNNQTIYDYLLKTMPWLKRIAYWPRLDTAGAGSKERIMVGELSPDNAQAIVWQDFEQFPPQLRNLMTVILCHFRWGGVSVRYPKAFTYMDG